MLKVPHVIFLMTLLLTLGCKGQLQNPNTFEPTFNSFDYFGDATDDTLLIKNETHYGILTPLEITEIFNRLSIPYDAKTTNPTSSEKFYLSNAQAAINMGVYGVDFGYLHMFGFGQDVVNYMFAIKDLSNKLGIPDELILNPINSIENSITDADSVTKMMNIAYKNIESHLKRSDRASTAGLIVMGGWIEAMFLSTKLAYDPNNPDVEVVQRIAEQKYTLNSLLSFLKNYYNDPVVVFYTKKLKFLKNYFDQLDIYFDENDLEIDTDKQVLRSSVEKMDITTETLDGICNYIALLRTEIISL